jgi:hypothetical protein
MYYCLECGRKGHEVNGRVVHQDGRIKHPFQATINVEEEKQVAPRTRMVSPTGDEEYKPVLDPDDSEDRGLLELAQSAFSTLSEEEREVVGDAEDYDWEEPVEEDEPPGLFPDEAIASAELSENEAVQTVKRETKLPPADPELIGTEYAPATNPLFGRPKKEDMVTVRGGGLYLTARRRISWMRGEPQPRPDWTIDTYPEEIERGKFISNNKVEGGYARYRANVFDAAGRLIGTGTKTEWSERFMDFAEKAETGAIARALAVCGFGTEAALDLDEGYEQDRIADAPVSDSRPITITPSSVAGLVQGGRSQNVTGAQINEIQRLIRVSAMGMTIVPFMEGVLEKPVPPLGEHPAKVITEFLEDLTFEEASLLIQKLIRAMADDA